MPNTEVPLSISELQTGAREVEARLRAGASPNRELPFPSHCAPPSPGYKVTPLGYAILTRDARLLEVLLEGGAEPHQPVALAELPAFQPLHLAVALGWSEGVVRLLAHGADPNAPLQSSPRSADRCSPLSGRGFSLAMLYLDRRVRTGDRPLHIAVDCDFIECGPFLKRRDGLVVKALLQHAATNVNATNARGRTALYKACERGSLHCAQLLVAHPGADVDAGFCAPLFPAVRVESPELVRLLLHEGATADGLVRSGSGCTPLQYAVYRQGCWPFFSRAAIVSLLVGAGAAVEPAMVQHAAERQWYWVQAALKAGDGGGGGGGGGDSSSDRGGDGSGGTGCGSRNTPEHEQESPLPQLSGTGIARRFQALYGKATSSLVASTAGLAFNVYVLVRYTQKAPVHNTRLLVVWMIHGLLMVVLVTFSIFVYGRLFASSREREQAQEEEREWLAATQRQQGSAAAQQPPLIRVGEAAAAEPSASAEGCREWCGVAVAPRAPRAGAARGLAGLVAEEEEPLLPPGGASTAAAPGAGRAGVSAGAGAPRGGLDGLCCACMERRAVVGFVHAHVVHCCLCAECEGELRQHGALACCPICKLPAAAVCRIIAT